MISLLVCFRWYQQQEEERLVTGTVEEQPDQERDIEMNGRESIHEVEEALLRPDTRPELEERPSLESSTDSIDPLYERVRQSVNVEVQPVPSEPKEEPRQEPIYAKVQ